jgi:glycosyltransferase involved in cell wall biosynthesis
MIGSQPRKRRLLVITFHFPPDQSVGGNRWAGLSKYLARLGWEVHVVTASSGEEFPMAGVHRHFRARRDTLEDWYRARSSSRSARAGTARGSERESIEGAVASHAGKFSAVVRWLRRLAASAISLPDRGRGWVLRAALCARGLLRENEFDCVVSSGPPHSAHVAAWLATAGTGVPFWIDMRDPWAVTYKVHAPPDPFIRHERRFQAWLEGLVFARAARVLVNTKESRDELLKSRPHLQPVYFPNGVDRESLPLRTPQGIERGSMAHVGTLYAGRSFSPVFAAMRLLAEKGCAGATDLRLHIAGPLESPHREIMQGEIEALGLGAQVKAHGILSRPNALELLSRAEMALVLAQNQPLCVPAKLYESVALGTPTLVIAEPDSAAAGEARRVGAMTVDAGDVAGISALLADMLAGKLSDVVEPKAAISYEDLARDLDTLLVEELWGLQSQPRVARESLPHPA